MTPRNEEDLRGPRGGEFFVTLAGVCELARPLGVNRVRKLLEDHPQAPRPVFGGDRAGSKAIYSRQQARQFLDLLANGERTP